MIPSFTLVIFKKTVFLFIYNLKYFVPGPFWVVLIIPSLKNTIYIVLMISQKLELASEIPNSKARHHWALKRLITFYLHYLHCIILSAFSSFLCLPLCARICFSNRRSLSVVRCLYSERYFSNVTIYYTWVHWCHFGHGIEEYVLPFFWFPVNFVYRKQHVSFIYTAMTSL